MSVSSSKPSSLPETSVSNYERISAAMTAIITVLGILVTLALLIWMMFVFRARRTEAVAITDFPGAVGEKAPLGEAEDLEEPGVEEFPEVEVPQLTDALEAVTDAVSTVQARLEKVDGSSPAMGTGSGLGHREGGGEGGTGGNPYDRWRIEYASSDIQTYSQQLTFFAIEIGVVSRNTQRIDLVNNLSRPTPLLKTPTTRRDERRIYLTHVNPKLRQWDQTLVRRAGINSTQGRFIVQFYPPSLAAELLKLETEYAQANGKDLKNVVQTLFKVREAGQGYEYYVAAMD